MTPGDQLSGHIEQVSPLGIWRFFELAEEADDIISLGVGKLDFSVPWAAQAAAIDSFEHGKTSCTSSRGTRELREAISERIACYGQEYDLEDEITVTTDVSEVIDLAFRALVGSGDAVAIPQSPYISYAPGAIFAGGEPLPAPTRVEDESELTFETFEATEADETDVLVLYCPNNPISIMMTDDELAGMASFVRDHSLVVLFDKIYSDFRYESDHASIATHPDMRERTIVFNGSSKACAMTELCLGYAMGPPGAIDTINEAHRYAMLPVPTAAQCVAFEALRFYDGSVGEMHREHGYRRRSVLARFEEMGLDCFETKGAFYVFPETPDGNDKAFAEGPLGEQNVALAPGSVFGEGGTGHLHVSYATGIRELRKAMDRIEAYVNG